MRAPPFSYLYIRGRGDLLQKILCCRFMDRFFQTRNIFDERKKLPKENVNFLAFHAYKLACFRNERGLNFDRQDESRFLIKEILKDTSRPSTSFYFRLLFTILRFKEQCGLLPAGHTAHLTRSTNLLIFSNNYIENIIKYNNIIKKLNMFDSSIKLCK